MRRLVAKTVAGGLLVVLSALLAGAAPGSDVRGTFERSFQVSGPVNLEVENGSGDISVRQGSSGRVEIRAKIHVGNRWIGSANAERAVHEIENNPPVHQDGNSISIRPLEEELAHSNISIDYDISTPAETRLRSTTGSGDVTVAGIRGPVSAQTGSGDVNMSGLRGDVRAHTGSGDAKFDSIEGGRLDVQTGSGDVKLRDVRCALEARTGSGDIQAEGNPTGAWSLRTGSGEVTLRLPPDLAFDLNAHTGSGDVDTHGLPITVEGTFGHGELRGKVRGGGVLIEVQTSSGDIRID